MMKEFQMKAQHILLIQEINELPHEKTNNLHMQKQTQISFAVTVKLISAYVFATRIVQFVYFMKSKFPVSNDLLCMYSSVCDEPVRKPHCWFSHEAAHADLDLFCLPFITYLKSSSSYPFYSLLSSTEGWTCLTSLLLRRPFHSERF